MTHRVLMFLGFAALLGALSGCATTWAISSRLPWDENQRDQDVPLPGTTETLTVTLVLHEPASAQTATGTSTAATGATETPNALRFACAVAQHGRTKSYHAATKYGRQWKTGTAFMVAVEALVATGFYFAIDNEENAPSDRLLAMLTTAWMAADAVGTGVLFFMPRRDVYTTLDKESSVPVRSDCPEGLAVEIDGRPVAINALGQMGALGQALLEQYMTDSSPGQPALLLRVGEHSAEMYLDAAERCAWAKARGHESASTLCEAVPQAGASSAQQHSAVQVVMKVPPGTFTGPPPPPPAQPSPPAQSSPEASEAATESPREPWAPPASSDQSPSP